MIWVLLILVIAAIVWLDTRSQPDNGPAAPHRYDSRGEHPDVQRAIEEALTQSKIIKSIEKTLEKHHHLHDFAPENFRCRNCDMDVIEYDLDGAKWKERPTCSGSSNPNKTAYDIYQEQYEGKTP